MTTVRLVRPPDRDALVRMRQALWPDSAAEEVDAMLAGESPGTMVAATFVAEDGEGVIGFIEVDLRSHADGCNPLHAVGFLEGWFVDARYRKQGVGAALVHAAEEWARGLGCVEMASDTWIDAEGAQRAHAAVGYEEVDRCVHYRKTL
jgi:aminoglycoside 6'-N-acetyltransferase I